MADSFVLSKYYQYHSIFEVNTARGKPSDRNLHSLRASWVALFSFSAALECFSHSGGQTNIIGSTFRSRDDSIVTVIAIKMAIFILMMTSSE